MSRRGEICVECDAEDCQAVGLFYPDDFKGCDIETRLSHDGWDTNGTGKHRRDLCPQCVEEIIAGKRCDRCHVKLDNCARCGDCYGGTECDPQARSWESAATPFDPMN